MNTYNIKQLLADEKVSALPEKSIASFLVDIFLKIYALAGITRISTPEQINSEIAILVKALSYDLINDSDFKQLRIAEIDYALMAGIRGEFDEPKQKSYINYPTIYRWLKAYFYSDERKQAVISIQQEKQNKQLSQKIPLTSEEEDKIILESINKAYQDFLHGEKMNVIGQNLTNDGVLDFGRVKDRYLTRKGLKPDKMKIEDFFLQCKNKGLKKIL
jgi:hypothetical protein